MFDPQASYLPNVNPANPGKMIDFLRHRQLIEGYPDQFLPLEAFGCSVVGTSKGGKGPPSVFDGTLFRFALRTEEQAGTSRLSKQAHTVESMREQLGTFAEEAPSMLLFLKNVERLAVYEWSSGAGRSSDGTTNGEPHLLFEVSIANISTELRQRRNFVATVISSHGGKLPPNPAKCDYRVKIVSKSYRWQDGSGSNSTSTNSTTTKASTESWMVCNILGGGKASQLASAPQYAHLKLIPWAGVAGRLSPEEDDDKVSY